MAASRCIRQTSVHSSIFSSLGDYSGMTVTECLSGNGVFFFNICPPLRSNSGKTYGMSRSGSVVRLFFCFSSQKHTTDGNDLQYVALQQ